MKKSVGALLKVALAVVLVVSAVGAVVNVAGAANTYNVPRIPRTDQEEATHKTESTPPASTGLAFPLLARGRSQERESPTIPSGPFTLSDRASMIG